MKYHVSVDCQERYICPRDYIFPKELYFPEVRSTEGKYCPEGKYNYLATPTCDISSVPVDICYIRWSKLMISSKFYVLYDPTKFGNKTRSLHTKQNWTQTWQLARVLLWRSIVNHCVLCVRGAFLSRSVSQYGIDVVVVVAFILFTELLYFCDCVTSVVRTQFLTGCLCVLKHEQARPSNITSYCDDWIKAGRNTSTQRADSIRNTQKLAAICTI